MKKGILKRSIQECITFMQLEWKRDFIALMSMALPLLLAKTGQKSFMFSALALEIIFK